MIRHQMPDALPSSVQARSISRSVWEELKRAADAPLPSGTVLAVFQRAYHLVLPPGELVAVVLPEIGDGPLNIVLGGEPGALPTTGSPVQMDLVSGWLQIGRQKVILKGVTVWEPRPNWGRLRARAAAVQDRLPHLATLVRRLAPPHSCASFLTADPTGHETPGQAAPLEADQGWSHTLRQGVSGAIRLLSRGWAGDAAHLRMAASRLVGLGRGLTPSGDDFLLGVMIWAWLAHPAPECICRPLLEDAHVRTTALSTSLLRAASRGECSAPWHHLLDVLSGAPDGELVVAVQTVLKFGHTSGADALAGFTWMGLCSGSM